MIKKQQRPLIDRPRYVSKPPTAINNNNKPVNKPVNRPTNKLPHKRKVVDEKIPRPKIEENQIQQPLISGSVNPIDGAVKDDGGMFKQMKDKLIGKPKKQG